MMKKERIHSRNICVDCYETEERGVLLVEGSLTDERLLSFLRHTDNTVSGPGKVHHMTIMMTLSIPDLRILSIQSEMPVFPVTECLEIKDSVKKLEGMQIKSGFTNEVRELLGKREGCLHLTNLLLAMSSAAVQGVWSYFSRVRGEAPMKRPEMDPSMLIDSCWLWRADGPFAKRFGRNRTT